MNRVCVLATQRSGSTWVMDSIQKSANVPSVLGELLLDRPAKGDNPWGEPWGNLVPPVRFWDWRSTCRAGKVSASSVYLSFLETLYRTEPVFAFKLMQGQLMRKPQTTLHLKRRGYSVVHLVRRNLLEVYVSRLRMGLGAPHMRGKVPKPGSRVEKLRINPRAARRSIVRELRMRRLARLLVRSFGIPVQQIEYEKLIAQDSVEIERLSDAVGCAVDLWHGDRLKKLSFSGVEEKIENYDEVVDYLQKRELDPATYRSTTTVRDAG